MMSQNIQICKKKNIWIQDYYRTIWYMPNKCISNWHEQRHIRFLEIVFDFKVSIYVKCQGWGNVRKLFEIFIDWKWKPAMYRKIFDYAPFKKFFNWMMEFVVLFPIYNDMLHIQSTWYIYK